MNDKLEHAILHLADRDRRTREKALAEFHADPPATLRYLIESLRTNPGIRRAQPLGR